MVRLYHVSILLLAGLAAAAAVAADLPGGKKVTITMGYAAAADPPGKKFRISVRYTGEDHGSHDDQDQLLLDCDDDEPYVQCLLSSRALLDHNLGVAVQYLLTILEKQRDYQKASRSEL